MSVKYIHGHNPDLIIYHDGVLRERIDLKGVKTRAALEALLNANNVRKKKRTVCVDEHGMCRAWAEQGLCARLQNVCAKSCNACETKVEL